MNTFPLWESSLPDQTTMSTAALPFNNFAPLAEPAGEAAHLRQVNRKLLLLLGHELGSPLTLILGYLRLWQERNGAVAGDELDMVVEQALSLKERLDDMILLDELEAGLWHIHPERVTIEPLLQQLVRRHRQALAQKKIRLELKNAASRPVLADPAMLTRALDHLISNACKFSPEGVTISIAVRYDETLCAITVADRGIGIPAERQAEIFELFVQLDHGRARRYVGLGIGLKLVRAIVERHGGRVTVRSRAGGGSAFTLTLPLAAC